jgi:tetratricopeptide (TPR) repeat protein
MKLDSFLLTATLLALLGASAVSAQMTHPHSHDPSEKLGKVNFIVSCSVSSQKQFNRATALLHSFWYDEAENAFAAIARDEPDCAMAHWGVAMSLYHPVWAPSTAAELQKGWTAVEKAKSIGAKTDRERLYIAAINAFYEDFARLDHRTRALAYEKAMERVYLSYPRDHEAAIFYALALLGTGSITDKTFANQRKAAAILNRVLPQEPEHPGVAHYLIHSFDYPQLAPLALRAARSYARIAPSSPHALHMPSHIFTRLGLWQESINSNLASAAAARNHVARTHPGATSFDALHALDYLVYAYLQRGEDRKARRILDQANAVSSVDSSVIAAAYALAAIPARYALERRSWSEAAHLELHPATFPWDDFRYAEAIIYFARAIGAARSGDKTSARKDVEKLSAIQNTLAEAKDNYWANQVEIQRRGAAAWLAHAEGKHDEALTLMRSAADLEAASEKHPVTPGPIIPARALLGDMLMESKQPEQALREFETSLRDSPNRFNGLWGAARAAQLSGDRKKARGYYAQIVTLSAQSDSVRAELREAKAFLAGKELTKLRSSSSNNK